MPIWLEGHPETYQKAVMKSLKQDFLIVPKPSSNNLDSEWSLHFPFAEKMILRNTKCAKPVIKLLKVKYIGYQKSRGEMSLLEQARHN